MMTSGEMIDVADLPPHMHAPPEIGEHVAGSTSTPDALEEQERLMVMRAMESANVKQSQAERILRTGSGSLRDKLKKFGPTVPAHPE
jgi:DNA-binding NtrC family response regulator